MNFDDGDLPYLLRDEGNSTTPHPIYTSGVVEKFSPIDLSKIPEPGPRVDLVAGLLPQGHIALLYGDGGQGKSYLGLILASMVVLGKPFLGFQTKRTGVLYVDWELDQDEHGRRAYQVARGIGLNRPPENLYYLRAERPIKQLIGQLKVFISENEIGLVILDSFGAACDGDPELAKSVIPLLARLRSLQTTILLMDHQSKLQEGQNYDNKTPFGSAYKYNLARSVIQVKRINGKPGQLNLLLKPTKFNLGLLGGSLPCRLLFQENFVSLEQADLLEDEVYWDQLPAEEKIRQSLTKDGPATTKTLSDRTAIKCDTVTNTVGRMKKRGEVRETGKEGHAPIYELTNSTTKLSLKGSGVVEKRQPGDDTDLIEGGKE